MKFSYALVVVLAVSACKRVEGEHPRNVLPVQEVVAGVPLIDFNAPGFSCRAPSEWGVPEMKYSQQAGTLFVGPDDPVKKTSARIAVHKYPEFENGRYKDAKEYAETFWQLDQKNEGQPKVEQKKIGDATVFTFHQERKNYRVHGSPKIDYWIRYDYALIPIKGGFFEIVHQAPTDSYEKTLPVFEAVVKSFKPKS